MASCEHQQGLQAANSPTVVNLVAAGRRVTVPSFHQSMAILPLFLFKLFEISADIFLTLSRAFSIILLLLLLLLLLLRQLCFPRFLSLILLLLV